MEKKWNKKQFFIALNFICVLVLLFFSVWKEEGYRKEEAFYLKLAPVDPRSLLQGDYMVLNYDIVVEANEKLREFQFKQLELPKRGFIVVHLDENRLAHFQDIVTKPYSDKNLLFIAFHSNGFQTKINADSFLFEEGKAKFYEDAQYSKVVLINHRLRLLDLVHEVKKP